MNSGDPLSPICTPISATTDPATAGTPIRVSCCALDGSHCWRGGCIDTVDFADASLYCAANERRLCTADEFDAGLCTSMGCSFDTFRNWSSTSCDPPTEEPTADPTPAPTPRPTKVPTPGPTGVPSTSPTKIPTVCMCQTQYTDRRSNCNTLTDAAHARPDGQPDRPTKTPTGGPTKTPTDGPTKTPTHDPTPAPTSPPSPGPTSAPTTEPTIEPTRDPTVEPTAEPTRDPTTEPTYSPTTEPTRDPTRDPTCHPTTEPTLEPTEGPTNDPTVQTTGQPSHTPTASLSTSPSQHPSPLPSTAHSPAPSTSPSTVPSAAPSLAPSVVPSQPQSRSPNTAAPTLEPTEEPTIDDFGVQMTSGDLRDPSTLQPVSAALPSSDATTEQSLMIYLALSGLLCCICAICSSYLWVILKRRKKRIAAISEAQDNLSIMLGMSRMSSIQHSSNSPSGTPTLFIYSTI